jgi:hypothetical protein
MTQAPADPRSRLVFPGLGTALPSQPVVFGVRQHLAPLVAVDFTGVVVVREHVFPRLLRPCDALPPSSARLGSRVMSLVRSRHMVRGTALSVDTSGSVASAGNPWDEGSRPVLWSHQRRARPGLVLVHRLVQRLGQVAAPGSTWLVVARNTALASSNRLLMPCMGYPVIPLRASCLRKCRLSGAVTLQATLNGVRAGTEESVASSGSASYQRQPVSHWAA